MPKTKKPAEWEDMLSDLEAQIAGAKAVIAEYKKTGGDEQLSLVMRLLDKAIDYVDALHELLGPSIAEQLSDEIARRRAAG